MHGLWSLAGKGKGRELSGKGKGRDGGKEKRNHVEHKNTRDGWINDPKVIFIIYQLFNRFYSPERNLFYTNKFLTIPRGRGRKKVSIIIRKQEGRGKGSYLGVVEINEIAGKYE